MGKAATAPGELLGDEENISGGEEWKIPASF